MDLKNVATLGNPNRRSLADQLYTELRERIRSGELSPGERLPTEKDFTEAFGVSRTTVREALARLAQVQSAQASLRMSCAQMVPAAGLPLKQDGLHLTTPAQRRLGAALSQAMIRLRKDVHCR